MPFKVFRFFRCLVSGGHDFTNSKAKRGFMTCKRCGYRRRWR